MQRLPTHATLIKLAVDRAIKRAKAPMTFNPQAKGEETPANNVAKIVEPPSFKPPEQPKPPKSFAPKKQPTFGTKAMNAGATKGTLG